MSVVRNMQPDMYDDMYAASERLRQSSQTFGRDLAALILTTFKVYRHVTNKDEADVLEDQLHFGYDNGSEQL